MPTCAVHWELKTQPESAEKACTLQEGEKSLLQSFSYHAFPTTTPLKDMFFGRSELKNSGHMHCTIPQSSLQSEKGACHMAQALSLQAGDPLTEGIGHFTTNAGSGDGASPAGGL